MSTATTFIDEKMEKFSKYLDRTNMSHKQYQFDGVRWCLNNELREDPPNNVRGGFIADEMGLGKTIMMIGLMYCNFVQRTLVVLPPVLIDQWYMQIYRTTGHKALIYHGEAKKQITSEQLSAAKIVITSYGGVTMNKNQLLENETTVLHKLHWSRIVFDEAHHLRNLKTNCYTSSYKLKADIRWLVSGTPIQNSKQDFYNLCKLIRIPASVYCYDTNLQMLTENFILKRTKKQVGIIIADLNKETDVVDWTNEKEMKLSEEIHSALAFSRVKGEKGFDEINGDSKPVVSTFANRRTFSLMLAAKQSCIYPKLIEKRLAILNKKGGINIDFNSYREAFDCSSKLKAATDEILERKDNGNGKLIFCQFREEIDQIESILRAGGIQNIATFDGRTSIGRRKEILNEKNDVLILQIQTGCEGLNLQENYSEIYFISPNWNPAVEDQAIARCHRIGQTKPVYVKRYIMEPFANEETNEDDVSADTMTIDSYIKNVQENKRIIADEIIGNDE